MVDPDTPSESVMPERKATWRLGQRELHAIQLVVILLIVLPLLFVGYRVFLNFKAKRDITIAESNLHNLYVAMTHYSLDWDNKLPPAETWMDAAAGYLPSASGMAGGRLACLQGPGDGEQIRYVYNDLASGYNLQDDRKRKIDPAHLILLIEQPGAPPNAHMVIQPDDNQQGEDALYKQLRFPHYSDDPGNATTVILYANGDVKIRTRLDFTGGRQAASR